MFGETTISYVKIGNHPIETTIYKQMFQVPGIYIYIIIYPRCQGIVGCTPIPTYPGVGKSLKKSPISRGYLWVFSSPRTLREHNKYHGYTYVRGIYTLPCPLKVVSCISEPSTGWKKKMTLYIYPSESGNG